MRLRKQAIPIRHERAKQKRPRSTKARLRKRRSPAGCGWNCCLLAYTWTLQTLEGKAAIAAMVDARAQRCAIGDIQLSEVKHNPEGFDECWFSFSTAIGRGLGHLRLKQGLCWTLFTTLQSLHGFEEKTGRLGTRERGTTHGVIKDRQSWLEQREEAAARIGHEDQPYCLIVGGGQGGMGLGARLRRLGVPNLIIDKHERPGDSWRKRYRSLCLHDPVWYDHLPYLPFPDHWPVFTPKDKMGDWLESYARIMELDYWTNTLCRKAKFDEQSKTWEVQVLHEGRPKILRPKHLVIATGMSGQPRMPQFKGQERFTGALMHSSRYQGEKRWRDKRCVVLGSNNSAHDIAADLWEQGAEVTMLQRSPTIVIRSESLQKHAWGRLYSEEALAAGISTEKADLMTASWPHRLIPAIAQKIVKTILREDADLYEGLRRAGFMVHMGEDDSGIHTAYSRRGSGYYIEVGASQLIIEGKIGLRSPAEIIELEEQAAVLSTGEHLPADLIVCATGYGPMQGWAESLISRDVARKIGPCWGLGSDSPYDPGPWEGELRNMWKPTAQEALWFHGGNLMQSRHFSIYLALQIKARYEGLPVSPYRESIADDHRGAVEAGSRGLRQAG
ncbi:MAG: NAD(P)/FAD-dependent oxidoreductase [Betaproteobacteria bacterium]|nr:NAD(P)/FAD-dependent oxidoreductase [Betaproteobacteria bacterium]